MQDHHVIAIYYHTKAYDCSSELLVHFDETESDAQQWVLYNYFKGRIDNLSEQCEFIDQHITLEEKSVSECLNILLENTREQKDLEHNLKYAQGMTFANGSVAFTSVKIGDQVWMEKNLAIDDGGEGIFYNPKNKEYYYTWDAAVRIAKAIPGWHLPSVDEWNEACEACGVEPIERVGCVEDVRELYYRLKVLSAGYYNYSFSNVGDGAYFWASTESGSFAYYRGFGTGVTMGQGTNNKGGGYSVRLVKDK